MMNKFFEKNTSKIIMNKIGIFTIASPLHDQNSVKAMTEDFLNELSLGFESQQTCNGFDFLGNDFSEYGKRECEVIVVCTGGTEGEFLKLLPQLRSASKAPIYLLATPKNNSLPASMEILAYLRGQGIEGEILHGEPKELGKRIQMLSKVENARRSLRGTRLGVIGKPSDWLIASAADYGRIKSILGIDMIDIPMQELLDEIASATDEECPYEDDGAKVRAALPGAWKIYLALKKIVKRHDLQGFTLRCFDLLSAVRNTGCLALARLNAEGITAGCEGDIPTLLSMTIARALTGEANFQANPAYTREDGHVLFAHCTIPLSIVNSYEFDTHFESGIGVGIRGYATPGSVAVFKVAGDLSRYFIDSMKLEECQANEGLCRTQMLLCSQTGAWQEYFKKNPIGNHHVIVLGNHAEALRLLMNRVLSL